MVPLPRQRREKNAYFMRSYAEMWHGCNRLVKRYSSHSRGGQSHQAGVFQLGIKLLHLVHQHSSSKLHQLLLVLYQWYTSSTPMSSPVLWHGLSVIRTQNNRDAEIVPRSSTARQFRKKIKLGVEFFTVCHEKIKHSA